MSFLARIPASVYLIGLAAALLSAGGIGMAMWNDAAETERVALGGGANMQAGLAYAFFAGIVPAFTWIGAGIASGILVAKRVRGRQDAGALEQSWGIRATTSLGHMLAVLLLASMIVWLCWLAVDAILYRAYGEYAEVGSMTRNVPAVFGLVFGLGMTGALPAILLTASAPGPDDE